MKWIVPNTVQVGGRVMRIRANETALEVADLSGQCQFRDSIIRLSLVCESVPRSKISILSTLIHEIVHVVDGLFIKDLEERQTGALGEGIAQALISMGIEPDFSQIPEEEGK